MNRPRPTRNAAMVIVAFGLLGAGCGSTETPTAPAASDAPSGVTGTVGTTADRVALQAQDLPAGTGRCDYSGPIEGYISYVEGINDDTYRSVSATWARLMALGATEGYASFFGSTPEACANLLIPQDQRRFVDEEEHIIRHPRMAFSLVFGFADAAAAEAAYQADVFGQSAMRNRATMLIEEGTTTGLTPNAIVNTSKGAPIQTRQVVWQQGRFNVLFATTAIDVAPSAQASAAMAARMR